MNGALFSSPGARTPGESGGLGPAAAGVSLVIPAFNESASVEGVVGRAREVLFDKGLVAVGSDPDGPPPTALGWPGAVVTDQSPESGAKVPTASSVTLWVERGGGSGVREPRRPKPTPRAARGMVDETSDEAVG